MSRVDRRPQAEIDRDIRAEAEAEAQRDGDNDPYEVAP